MATETFSKEVSLNLSIGHLLAVWDILANKLSEIAFMDSLDVDEKRAIWALQDLCEQTLVENGVSSLPENEWKELVQAAKVHVRSIPVDFLE